MDTNGARMSATPELCQVIDSLVASETVPAAATLCDIREVVVDGGIFLSGEGELLYPQDRTFLAIELDELIAVYGAAACARSFTPDSA